MVFHLEKEVSKLDLTRGTEPQSKLQRSISLNIFSHLRSHDRKKHPVSIAPVLTNTLASSYGVVIFRVDKQVVRSGLSSL